MNRSFLVHFRAKNVFRLAFLFCLVFFLAKPALSQNTNSGEIRGTVTDASGAVVPRVTVTLTNIDTGVTVDFTTNGAGIYDTVSTPPGNYNITFSKEGFKKLTRGPIVLRVAVITEDAVLQLGAVTQEVTVLAGGAPLIHTETGQQEAILDAKTMDDLPQIGAGITGNDWANFNAFLPGASSSASGRVSEGEGAWNSGNNVTINGNMPSYANFLQDGATTQLPMSNNNDNAIFETIAEIQVTSSSFSAQYGLGGVVFNQISKGGANAFHGSAYEYWQNNILNAGSYFGNMSGLAVPYLRYDEWGGSIGGPIKKNKLFFFFDRDKIYDLAGSPPSFTTYPSPAMEAGNFANLPPLYDPSTQVPNGTGGYTRVTFQSECGANVIPNGTNCGSRNLIDSVAAKVLPYMVPPPIAHPVAGTCSPTYTALCENNYIWSGTAPNPNLRWFGRIDYNMSEKNRINFSITQKNNNAKDYFTSLDEYSGDVDGYNTQLTDTWTISPSMVNELRLSYTKQGNWFLPSSTIYPFDPTGKLGLQDPKFNVFPSIYFNNCLWCGGPGGYNTESLKSYVYAIYIENMYDPSDVLTLIKGKHILKFGGEVLISEANATPWGAHDSGSFYFTGNYTAALNATGTAIAPGEQTVSGSSFADFLLGDVQSWGASNSQMTGMRMKSPQAFIQDDFKVHPNLTLNLGLRWMGNTGMGEEHNRMGEFDPGVVNATGAYAGTMGSLWFGGQDNRYTIEKPQWGIFMPRLGFAWSPKNNTTVRGGFGLFAYNYSEDLYGGALGFGASSTGGAGDSSGGVIAPVVHLDASAATMATVLPYEAACTNPSCYILTGAGKQYGPNYTPYNVPPGKIYEWTLAIEHQFAKNFMGSIAYVGSHAYNLEYPTNLNQITNPALMTSNDVTGCDGLNDSMTPANPYPCNRPYPAFGGISGNDFDAKSNYNSLQVQVVKRYTNGLSFNANYTWAHMLDSQDSSAWDTSAGNQPWQIGNNPSSNYGNSNMDIRHSFHMIGSYELPVGKGKIYLSNGNTALDALLGGWRLSGTFIAQTGNPFNVYVGNDLSYARGGEMWYPNVVPGQNAKLSNPTIADWFNTAAFVAPTPGTFGNGARNSLYGPGLTDLNLSLGKTFHWRERFALTIRGDFINVLNHPSFGAPNSNVSAGLPSEGAITSVTNAARTGQISARLTF